jgi:uncharacterized protein (TIGR03435 family)
VASIKPSAPPSVGRIDVGLHIDGAMVRCSFLSLKEYIRMAYQVKDYQVLGPEWLASDRFDVAAKLPAGATRDQVREMVQSLLEDRFRLKLHRDHKEFPVYGLVVGKDGLKMKESAPPPDAAASVPVNITASGAHEGTTINLGNGASFTAADDRFEGTKLTMANTADLLARFADRPVVDMTGVKGRYDFTMQFSPDDFRAMRIRSALSAGVALPPRALKLLEESSGDALFAQVEKLGLKLESRKAPLEVLVIDHIERTPTDN